MLNLLVVLSMLAFVPAAFAEDAKASAATNAALVRYRDMESASRLSAEGQALYRADSTKKAGDQYCRDSIALAEEGRFREAIQAAAKALYLGENSKSEDLTASAKSDLGRAYLYANRSEEHTSELQQPSLS